MSIRKNTNPRNLDYVPEDKYTEAMWEAQKRIGQNRASAHKM